jgi:hypothetical protein
VKVALASSPGHAGRADEDFVGAVPGAAVLLDGAGIAGTEEICRHGTAWYAHTLGATLLGRLSADAATDLAGALADSVDEVASSHRHTCDLANPSSPQATVAVVRFAADRVDHLVLADAYVVLDGAAGAPQVLTDSREVDVRRECTAPLAGLAPGSPEYEAALPAVVAALRARRNQPGGYWIAKDDPRVAEQAVTGSVSRSHLRGAALLSNGAARLVDPYGLEDWSGLLSALRGDGPDALLRRLRAAEAERGLDEPDDATVAYCSTSLVLAAE